MLLIAYFYLLIIQPGSSGILAHAKAPDGSECMVIQKWNGWDNGGEPYTVSFYSRRPGEAWAWQYIDHEARRWSKCGLSIDDGSTRAEIAGGDGETRFLELHPPQPTWQEPSLLPPAK